ncbi:MAG TPA: Rne/Rng family ribonuclease [Stellaceae bacterium]|nr:Rne/Rng family ribonuclease [Stellaceae bacterium]
MGKRMLIDAAHPEETRVVVLSGNRLEEFDFESSTKKQVKGNIYLAKVTRVEPSLQAAFIDYGGNRHGFLAFSEIHADYYRIPVSDREGTEYDAPLGERLSELPDGASANAPVDGDTAAVTLEAQEAAIEQAQTLPEPVIIAETDDEPQPDLEPAAASELLAKSELESGPEQPAIEEMRADDIANGEAAAPIEAAVAREPFFELVAPEAVPTIEEVDTLDDDEAEEAGEQRRRADHRHRHYKIQEVVKRRQIMLVQVAKEERGNKGAALTTYLSLAGRYCVLMPNTARGGGVSRKIVSLSDRRRLKEILEDLDIPEGMGVIVRTAGAERSKAEIKRDYEYLMRLWSEIRDLTLKSTAPTLIHEEGNLIKRSIRDLYARDIDEVIVEGEEGYRTAKDFMRMLMPSHARRVQPYRDPQISLFHRFQVESQIDAAHSPVAQLRSGGYVVINQTEALVAIDVNSGRATRERNIEETALKTNLEASDEIARQLRLRDLAGLIVIDFIDMEEHRHNSAVERRLKEALKNDRARIQVGRISPFGLMEMSRQRLRPSLAEASTQPCPHCGGAGFIRSTESTALYVLRSIEEEGARGRSAEICVYVPTTVALYILNQKRDSLTQIEARYGLRVAVGQDDTLIPPNFRLERLRAYAAGEAPTPRLPQPSATEIEDESDVDAAEAEDVVEAARGSTESDRARERDDEERGGRRRRRRRGRRGDGSREHRPDESHEPRLPESAQYVAVANGVDGPHEPRPSAAEGAERENDGERRRRRRGRRGGGRWRNRDGALVENGVSGTRVESAPEMVEDMVEAAIEGAEIPAVEAVAVAEIPESLPAVEPAVAAETPPTPVGPATADAEAIVEAAIESSEIPAAEPGPMPEPANAPPKRVRASRAKSEPRPTPPAIDVHPVIDKPETPRRGWWQRLTQP